MSDTQGRTYRVKADGELLDVQAESIFQAFNVARAMRPRAVVVTDTAGGPDALPAVKIPAEVRDNSETVKDYAFRRDISPHQWPHTLDARDKALMGAWLHKYTVYSWNDVNPDRQRCRFDVLVNRDGVAVHLFHTEYYTRVACMDCEYSYAQHYLQVTDADGVTHPAAPFCGTHADVVRKITARQAGYSLAESEPLRIGQH